MKRILLKLSGEALAGAKKTGFDEETVIAVSRQIRTIAEEGTQVGIVIGGGNFWRGRTSETINRNKADQIGMLATVMNCIYVSDICRYLGLETEIFTPFVCGAFTKLYSKDTVVQSALFIIACREQNHRNMTDADILFYRFAQFVSIHNRHHHIAHYNIRNLLLRYFESFPAIMCYINCFE